MGFFIHSELYILKEDLLNFVDLFMDIFRQNRIESTFIKHNVKGILIFLGKWFKHVADFIFAHSFHKKRSLNHVFDYLLAVIRVDYFELGIFKLNVLPES